jgi:hypothetical protein
MAASSDCQSFGGEIARFHRGLALEWKVVSGPAGSSNLRPHDCHHKVKTCYLVGSLSFVFGNKDQFRGYLALIVPLMFTLADCQNISIMGPN